MQRSEKQPRIHDRWQRAAIESCKQSGRLWLPTFTVADSLKDAIQTHGGQLLAATNDMPTTNFKEACDEGSLALVIGPEGDFTAEEVEAVQQSGGCPVRIEGHVLRSELAAVVVATLLLHRSQRLRLTEPGPPSRDARTSARG